MLNPPGPLDRETFAQPRDSSLTLRMTCRNHRIVILMSLGEEGSRFFSIQNHFMQSPPYQGGNYLNFPCFSGIRYSTVTW